MSEHQSIQDRQVLEKLKPIVRTNMYSALFNLFFLGLGSLTAIMSILNHGLIKGVIVAILSLVVMILVKWYNSSEEQMKQIKCSCEDLDVELNSMLQCWLHKPFPNF